MKSYWKDIWQTVRKEKKRFLSIAVIATLGVTMMCGLRASCVDLRYSADRFFDGQNLFDIRVLSTLGITDDDLKVLAQQESVESVDGGYNETVYIQNDGLQKSIDVRTLSENGFNQPYILEGKLPEANDEIAITENFKIQTGQGVGDTIILDEESENLRSKQYKITAIIIDALDINSTEGTMGFRSQTATDYVGYICPDAADYEVYTVAYLSLKDTEDMLCYSDEYTQKVEQAVGDIESGIKSQREQARYDEVYGEAMDEWLEGKQEFEEEITDAEQEIEDARKELADAEEELAKARKDIKSGKKKVSDGFAKLEKEEKKANKEIKEAKKEIEDGKKEVKENRRTLKTAYKELTEGQKQLDEEKAALEQMQGMMPQEQYDAAMAEIEKAQAELDAGFKEYETGMAAIEKAEKELQEGEKELEKEEKKARKEIKAGKQKLEKSRQELLDGEEELEKGEKELADGKKELEENVAEFEKEKADAEKELADAKKEIDDIDMTKWYVQDRTALSAYSNVKSDADSIQAIGDIFPILFLTVALLISLTTITRMVDEERGLIGTYKALGFTNREIRRKYVVYAALACLVGGLIGDIGGYIILPSIIFVVFRVMYILPEYGLLFDVLYGIGGIVLFEVAIIGATLYACARKLRNAPATLMRPKAPKAGSRVLLERITFIWKKLSFLNKVTARNLFRYKKRLFMTVFGITGCMALLLCGFTFKNTVKEMMPQQYQYTYKYDLMAVAMDDDYNLLKEKMETDAEIEEYIPVRIESLEVVNQAGKKEAVQLIVVPEGKMIESYICLKNEDNVIYELKDGDIFITNNAPRILGFKEGDTVTWQNVDLVQVEAPVTKVVENYLGNMAYMTEATYRDLFDTYETNGVLAHFTAACENPSVYTDQLSKEDGILSAVSTQEMEDEFEPAFAILNMVVYVILVLAAMLAFVVLFTLSNTNISERERELATIKVLGFYNTEVHSYVNKETIILTGLGILCGMPAGWMLGYYIMDSLRFPSLEFYITLYPESYVISAGITILFALLVNVITNQTLNKIDMIEALKSVE